MTKNLLDISGKISDPIVKAYEVIAKVTKQSDTQFFIIGATARDIVFEHAYGIKAPRATMDIDLAVQVASWEEFQQLKDRLIATGNFRATNMSHRLVYTDNFPLDIVPFGAIEEDGGIIRWPPEHSFEMSMTGFQDVYANTQLARIRQKPALDVHVVAPAGLMVLKLFAWRDRNARTKKDAQDITFILHNYMDAGNLEMFWEQHSDLADVDYVEAGARMLGREMANLLSPQCLALIKVIIMAETGNREIYRLAEAMSGLEQFDQNLGLLEAFKLGLFDYNAAK